MLEASSLRSRKQSFSPTELKVNNNNNNTNNSNNNKDNKTKDKDTSSMTNDSGTSVSEAVITSDSAANKDLAIGVLALGHEAASSQGTPVADDEGDDAEEGEIDEDEDTSMKSCSPSTVQVTQQETTRHLAPSRIRSSKLSAEDLNGGLLDGALDDEDDDMDGDTEDTEAAQDARSNFADREAEEEEGEIDEEQEDEDDDDKLADTDDDTHLKVPKGPGAHGTASPAASEDPEDGSNLGDADGDVAMTEQEGEESEDDEDEGTPAGQSDDEGSELPEDEVSHMDDGDEEGDGDGDEEEEDEEEDDDDAPTTPETNKKDVTSFSHKPVLNRPQLIAEDLKDSGDELSDLSDFDDTDDSEDEEVRRSGKGKGASSSTGGSAAAASASASAASASATTNSRPSLGGRKRSLRETSREQKEQEEKVKKEIEEDDEANAPQSDKESESEMAEEEQGEEKGEGEEDGEEEEDLEKKQVYTEALEALSSIEVEFAHLRDKMYEERILELETEVEMINDGTHPELSTLMKEIEDKRDQRLRIARAWRTHLNEISQAEFEIKEYQAHCTFQSKKRELRTDLMNGIGQKQQQLRLELTLAENRARHQPMEKSTMLRARKHQRAMVTELRTVNDQYGFPVSNDLRMIAASELDEDFAAMGLHRRVLLWIMDMDKGMAMVTDMSYRRAAGCMSDHLQDTALHHRLRSEVEIYEEGSRCKVDGIWYRPNDPVVVLDAALGQYHAKYLFLANDEIMLQKTDGTKTRLHLNLFRGRKLYMQPRP
ncbi:hypothetical protein BGX23_005108 [Mortierella sp. AD031]|nr:hypothetical protein BGX23_005108 [Mortierella sp. AD031]KAG0217863.1 hypothetical protein BGX33_009295 [Mortierella sp. NVP41]